MLTLTRQVQQKCQGGSLERVLWDRTVPAYCLHLTAYRSTRRIFRGVRTTQRAMLSIVLDATHGSRSSTQPLGRETAPWGLFRLYL